MDFVKERIFTPLGMSSSTFSELEASKDGRLTHTFSREGRRIPFWISDSSKTLFAGPAGVISNAQDMVTRIFFATQYQSFIFAIG
jgi:CubicO group peptidase (beta-lactamase class C family)